MAKARDTFFYNPSAVAAAGLKPGEYAHHGDKTSGFIKISAAEINQIIYVSSKDFVSRLQACYGIPDENIINLIDRCNSSPEGIPETNLTGRLV